MGDIHILVCNYCEAKFTVIALTISILNTVYKHVKQSTNVCKHCKNFKISQAKPVNIAQAQTML